MNLHQMLLLLVRKIHIQSKKQLSDRKIMSLLNPLDKLFTKADKKDTKLMSVILNVEYLRVFKDYNTVWHSFVNMYGFV